MAKKNKPEAEEKGLELFSQLIAATGLPASSVESELRRILEKRGVTPENVTLEQLREATASYLREVMAELLDRGAPPGQH